MSRIAAAVVLALLAAVPLVAAVEPPVPLRSPLPWVPDELAGSGLTPEAAVRVSIDERGIVRKVEVLSIRPTTDYDEIVRQELVETLSRWRYAPERRDGVPEATTLEWRVRFPASAEAERERREDGGVGAGVPRRFGRRGGRRRRRAAAQPDPRAAPAAATGDARSGGHRRARPTRLRSTSTRRRRHTSSSSATPMTREPPASSPTISRRSSMPWRPSCCRASTCCPRGPSSRWSSTAATTSTAS